MKGGYLSIAFVGAIATFAGAVRATEYDRSPQSSAAAIRGVADELAAAFLTEPCRAGLSIATTIGGNVTFLNYGLASRQSGRRPSKNSIYEIASVTKTFTGALAARAVIDGKMDLDGDFRAYLPQPYPNLERGGVPLTLRTLASHRSGLPRDLPDSDAVFARRDFRTLADALLTLDRGYDRRRYLAALHGAQLKSTPGSSDAYSNIGMKVLGFGLETVRGRPFETLMRDSILRPLEMRDTGFVLSAQQRKQLVIGYDRFGRQAPYHLRNAGAAYGLYSTPADMVRYAQWQLAEDRPEIRLAHHPLVGTEADGVGLIWNLAIDSGQRMLWHGGGTFGMTSQILLYPETNEAYVLLANDSCENTESALKEMARHLHRTRAAIPDVPTTQER